MSLGRQAFTGIIWSSLERFSNQGITFILGLILARLVAPSEFGQIAMLSIFIAIAQSFIDSGFSNALMQKQDRTNADFSTVFYFNIIVSIVVYLILFICAPLIATFYKMPSLILVTRILALDIIINSFAIVQRTKLSIDLSFKTLTKISVISSVLSGFIGIMIAWKGYGIWGLLAQRLLNSFLQNILLWFNSHWYPLFLFSPESFKSLFGFGSKILMGGLLTTIYNNLYPLVIGRFFSASNVAYFTWSQQVANFPSNNLSNIISKVTYPVMCKIQGDDAKLESNSLLIMKMIAMVSFPLMSLICLFSKSIVSMLLTPKWAPAASLLAILSISCMLLPVMQQNWLLLNAKGRSDLSLKSEIYKKIFAAAVMIATIPLGLKALCLGLLLYSIVDMLVIMYYVRKVTSIGYQKQFNNLIKVTIAVLVMILIVQLPKYFLGDSLWYMFVGCALGATIYLIIIWNIEKKSITQCYKLIRR